MSDQELLARLKDAVVRGIPHEAAELARRALAEGIDPLVAYEGGLKAGIIVVGEAFATGEIFLPDLVLAGETMKAAGAILETEIERRGIEREGIGKVLLGTVAGDLHDIGKTIVATLLTSHGFDVVDIGVDVPTGEFIEKVEAVKPDILGMSSLLTVTAKELAKVIDALREAGMRDSVKVVVGGGAVTNEYAQEIGADGFGKDAERGVRVVKKLLGV